MNSFVDLKVSIHEDLSDHSILGRVFSAIHLELVERKSDDIGVCFPKAGRVGLGGVLRLHGSQRELDSLLDTARLKRLSDYYSGAVVRACPEGHTWRAIKRVQPKITAAKARRMVRRGAVSEDRAQALYNQGPSQLKVPYLNMSSGSTGQKYRLYIKQAPCDPPEQEQIFNSFGLGASVPWF